MNPVPSRPAVRRRPLAVTALLALVLAACSGSSASPIAVGPTPAPATPAPEPSDGLGPSAAPHGGIPEGCPTAQPGPLGTDGVRDVTLATELGEITIRIEGALSPIAAGNFVALAECGYYDTVVFHRVVPGFVIQGGDGLYGRAATLDPGMVGRGGPGYTILDEPVTARYQRGTVAMARTSAPDSVGSQFFIVLDNRAEEALASYNTYQIIGEVSAGMDVVDAIAAAADREIPSDPVVIESVAVETPTTP